MKSDIYKDHYQFEWDHRSHITSALNVPIAVATVIGGAITVMAQKFPYSNEVITWFFVPLPSLGAISIIVSAVFLFKAFHGYQYQRIPTPQTLRNYYDKLVEWHNQYGNGKADADKEFDDYFHKRMAEATEINARNNKAKSAYLYRTNTSLAVSLLFVAIASVPFLIKTVAAGEKIQLVKIVELPIPVEEKKTMPDNDQNQQTQTTDQVPEAPPPKPTPPPNENIKEHEVPPAVEKIIEEKSK